MNILYPVVLVVHILIGLTLIGLVLLQHGKGADMGAAFGSGSAGSLFGASGSANFLSRTTAVLAAVFFTTSLSLTYMASSKPHATASVVESPARAPASESTPKDAPVVPAAPVESKSKDIPK